MNTNICTRFLGVIEELTANGYTNAEINSICEILRKKYTNVKERYPTIAPVACLGPSGVGKSSTINSILHQVGVAYESDSSGRGTNLVHEFAAPTPEQTSMFKVVAPYLRREQISDIVDQHLWAVLGFLGADEGVADGPDELEVEDFEQKYITAIDFFHTLLRNRKDFSTREKVEDFFKSNMDTEAGKSFRLKRMVAILWRLRPFFPQPR